MTVNNVLGAHAWSTVQHLGVRRNREFTTSCQDSDARIKMHLDYGILQTCGVSRIGSMHLPCIAESTMDTTQQCICPRAQ
jgi:hypothetical protein